MRLNPEQRNSPQRGLSSVAAVILTLTVASAAWVAQSLAMGTSGEAVLAMASARAEAGAQAGLDWLKYQAAHGACAPSSSFSEGSGLPGFEDLTIVTHCTSQTSQEGAAVVTWFRLESLACTSRECPAATPGAAYAERYKQEVRWR